MLLTLRGEAVWQSTTGTVPIISGITFPGLSIKGLISIGPELELMGRMDASLSISGELNAGVVASWPRAEVYFPQEMAEQMRVSCLTMSMATSHRHSALSLFSMRHSQLRAIWLVCFVRYCPC